jgi:hypothetical protein
MKIQSKLGIGPMSSEIIEAVFRYSEKESEPLMLIASKNQIDWDKGYVNTWDTAEYMVYISELRKKYSKSQVYICRDHCGPGFKNNDLTDVYKTIDSDIENGFDLIHIDFCHYQGSHEDILVQSKKAIDYILKKNPKMLIEVGTDENKGEFLEDLGKIKIEMDYFSKIPNVIFYVCQSGSLIKEINQVGDFNSDFITKVRKLADQYKLGLKEHNADYLDSNKIGLRKGLVDAVNVAPQYGVLQTQLTIQKCLTYGIDFEEWLEIAYQSGKWGKWLHNNNSDNKFLCSVIAGHYNFSTPSYEKIYKQISKHENFREEIIQTMMNNFKMYSNNL